MMKALVLAGGLGTRLRPFTHSTAKQLMPVANKPVLHYGLEAIRDAGISQTVIVVGDRGDEIRQAVGTGWSFGLDVTYVRQDAPLGLAHCVQIARDQLGDDDFVMYLGDNVILGGIGHLVDDFRRQRADAMVMVARVRDPSRYGVAEISTDGRVLRLEEKPVKPRSDLALIGAYVFSPAIHQAVRNVTPNWRNEREITDAIAWLAAHGHPVNAHVFRGYWKDTGRAEDLLDCNRAVLQNLLKTAVRGKVDDDCDLDGPVVVDEGARVSASRVVGPAIIGFNTVVTDSYIGQYTSIGEDCDVVGAGLERSILLDGASVQGVCQLRDSIIGRQALVSSPPSHLRGRRLILGDHSQAVLAS